LSIQNPAFPRVDFIKMFTDRVEELDPVYLAKDVGPFLFFFCLPAVQVLAPMAGSARLTADKCLLSAVAAWATLAKSARCHPDERDFRCATTGGLGERCQQITTFEP